MTAPSPPPSDPSAATIPADWLQHFPDLLALEAPVRERLRREAVFGRMQAGERAYLQGAQARGYVLRLAGVTRVQKTAPSGREVVLYRVGPGETCVLTTSCLLGRAAFPAEGVAESAVLEAVIPPATFQALMVDSEGFRRFVVANYGNLLGDLIMLMDDLMFSRLDERLAQRLLALSEPGEGSDPPRVERTHQQLAQELGSAREAVSRVLKEMERKGWLRLGRSRIELLELDALRALGDGERPAA